MVSSDSWSKVLGWDFAEVGVPLFLMLNGIYFSRTFPTFLEVGMTDMLFRCRYKRLTCYLDGVCHQF